MALNELRSLLLVGQADEDLAATISKRGVSFPVTRAVLGELRERGAGRATLAALAAHLAPPLLVITTQPSGCEILVDGSPARTAATSGGSRVSDLAAGVHQVLVRKPGYRESERSITLVAGEEQHLEFSLKSLPAVLRVADDDPGLVVRVNGKPVGTKPLELAAGPYEATYECPVCKPGKETLLLAPGEERLLSPTLAVDERAVEELLARMRSSVQSGQDREAAAAALVLLRHRPDDPDVLTAAAEGYFLRDDGEDFVRVARAAMEHGARVRIPVRHRDMKMESALEPSFLVVDAKQIAFEPADQDCALARAPYALAELTHVAVEREDGYLWLTLGFRRLGAKKPETLRMADREAELRPERKRKSLGGLFELQYRGNVMTTRAEAQRSLESIRSLLTAIGSPP